MIHTLINFSISYVGEGGFGRTNVVFMLSADGWSININSG